MIQKSIKQYFNCTLYFLVLSIFTLLIAPNHVFAKVWGWKNIVTKTGLVSNIKYGPDPTAYIDNIDPGSKDQCRVKVFFMKVESATKAMDAYLDWMNKYSEQKGSEFWDRMREILKETESDASYTVYDSSNNKVEKVDSLGATSFGKKPKFNVNGSNYKVKIECSKGAGLYHVVFECK